MTKQGVVGNVSPPKKDTDLRSQIRGELYPRLGGNWTQEQEDEAVNAITNLIQERDTKLKEALLGALPGKESTRNLESPEWNYVGGKNDAIDQTTTAINQIYNNFNKE